MPTKLQLAVWEQLSKIPKGKVTTYKLLANAVGSRAVRAVASAVGKNPYAPIVPCHRVVLSGGEIGNYTHLQGITRKIELLKQESVEVKDGKVLNFEKILYKF